MTFGIFYTMPIDFPSIDVSEFNDRLTSLGLRTTEPRKAALGWGAQVEINRFILAFSRTYATRRDSAERSLLKLRYRATSFLLGYDLIRHPLFSLYPYVGIKSGRLDYQLRDRVDDTLSFNQYFQTPLQYKEASNTQIHFDAGLGVSHQWFYLVGFRAGYLIPIRRYPWEVDGAALDGAPRVNYNLYFMLTLGLGRVDSERSRPLPKVPNVM